MSLMNWLGIAEPIKAVGALYTTDKDRIDAQTRLLDIEQKPLLAQLDNTSTMLKSKYFFESAWPALIGWTSGFLVLLYYAPQIIISTYLWTKHSLDVNEVLPFPMKPDEILNLVYLLLGFGVHSVVRQGLLKK